MPCTVTLVYFHVVHLYRKPYVHSSMPFSVIDIAAYRETVGGHLTVLDTVNTRLCNFREINLSVIISVIVDSPHVNLGVKDFLLLAVVVDSDNGRGRKHSVVAVKFHHGHLSLCRRVTYLRETHIRLANPPRVIYCLNEPACHLPGLAGRKNGTGHEHSVLRKIAAVKEFDIAVRRKRNHKVISLRSHHKLMSFSDRVKVNVFSPAPVIKGGKSVELRDSVAVWTHP